VRREVSARSSAPKAGGPKGEQAAQTGHFGQPKLCKSAPTDTGSTRDCVWAQIASLWRSANNNKQPMEHAHLGRPSGASGKKAQTAAQMVAQSSSNNNNNNNNNKWRNVFISIRIRISISILAGATLLASSPHHCVSQAPASRGPPPPPPGLGRPLATVWRADGPARRQEAGGQTGCILITPQKDPFSGHCSSLLGGEPRLLAAQPDLRLGRAESVARALGTSHAHAQLRFSARGPVLVCGEQCAHLQAHSARCRQAAPR